MADNLICYADCPNQKANTCARKTPPVITEFGICEVKLLHDDGGWDGE